jgi:hypothetical protein
LFSHRKQDGQFPQLRQIHALVKLAFGHRAFAEEAGGDAAALLHLVCQGQSNRNRQAAADDGIAAIEALRNIEQVHRAAAALAAAFLLAIHLGHDAFSAYPARQRVAVLAVGGDNGVVGAQCLA